ncbi:hypothetical protein [Paracoccus sanguinis]|uniref:hypothetical protein n=1 Tax=Paracoccus sanguinis TaxID=1545044 RepID=UPI000A5DE3E9|nr:hypothetical protein [Paracoccus sanguinis]QJD15807.1 hypothetical protein HGN31_02080 [Paracoccus sanguinis]
MKTGFLQVMGWLQIAVAIANMILPDSQARTFFTAISLGFGLILLALAWILAELQRR